MNFFTIAPNDQSIYFLGQIFGFVGNVLPVQNAPLILGTMFRTFNVIALVLGVIVIIYTTIIGLLQTAHEGQFMGGKAAGLWTPLRMVFGILAVFPTPTGYCALQILIMWIVVQGIGAADTLWNTVLRYVDVTGSVYSSIPLDKMAARTQISSLFQGLTCQASAKAGTVYTDTYIDKPIYYCTGKTDSFCSASKEDMLNPLDPGGMGFYKVGPDGACGTLSYCHDLSNLLPPVNPDELKILNIVQVSREDLRGLSRKDVEGLLSMAMMSTLSPSFHDKILNYISAKKQAAGLGAAACKGQREGLKQIVPVLGDVAERFVTIDHDYIGFWAHYTPKPEDWIKNFCTDKNITPCCIHMPTLSNPGMGPPSIASLICPQWASFPKNYGDNNDRTNTSTSAITNLYMPYAMPELTKSDFIDTAVNQYVGSVVGAVTTYLSQQKPGDLSKTWMRAAQDTGWMYAGSYYYSLAATGSNNLQQANPPLSMEGHDPQVDPKGAAMKPFRNNYTAVGELLKALEASTKERTGFSGAPPQAQMAFSQMSTLSGAIVSEFIHIFAGKSANPLQDVQSFGQIMLNVIGPFFAILLIQAFLGTLFGNLTLSFFGAFVHTGIGEAITTLFIIMLPIFMAFVGALFVYGATLAIYLPLVPYVIFTTGVIGWLISVIEGMIAAPLVAVGIIAPGGQDILGHAMPALKLMLNVLLRPCLMIFGMIAAMLLASVAVHIINNTFASVMNQINGGPGVIEFIIFIGAYIALIVAVINKSFDLITEVPNQVMNWIGGSGMETKGRELEGAMKGGFGKGAAVTQAGMEGALGAFKPKPPKPKGKTGFE